MDDGYEYDYGNLWVLLAYFFSIVLFFSGWFNDNLIWVNWGLFFLLIGLIFNMMNKINLLLSILESAEIKYEIMDND